MDKNIDRTTLTKNDKHFTMDGHKPTNAIRNEISLELDIPGDNKYKITIKNVSFVNRYPCQIALEIENKEKLTEYSGPIIKQPTNENNVKISNIKSNQSVQMYDSHDCEHKN